MGPFTFLPIEPQRPTRTDIGCALAGCAATITLAIIGLAVTFSWIVHHVSIR